MNSNRPYFWHENVLARGQHKRCISRE